MHDSSVFYHFGNTFEQTCPSCGAWHDDGGLMELDGKKVYLCMDCADLPRDVVIKMITKRKQE